MYHYDIFLIHMICFKIKKIKREKLENISVDTVKMKDRNGFSQESTTYLIVKATEQKISN